MQLLNTQSNRAEILDNGEDTRYTFSHVRMRFAKFTIAVIHRDSDGIGAETRSPFSISRLRAAASPSPSLQVALPPIEMHSERISITLLHINVVSPCLPPPALDSYRLLSPPHMT